MPLISHRGSGHLEHANTSDAIRAGDTFSPDYIEVDINCTKDDVLVIHHGSVSRFLRGKKTNETFKELQEKYPYIFTLDQLLALRPKSPFMFDIKIQDPKLLKTIAEKIATLDRKDFAFTSPHESSLIFMKKTFPESLIFQSQPYHHGPISALEIARKNKFEGVSLNKWWMTPLVHRLCKAHSKKMMCYTIDNRFAIKLVMKYFPDVYIVTNRPDVYTELARGHMA